MSFSALLTKMATAQPLNTQEMIRLKQYGMQVELLTGQYSHGTTTPRLDNPIISTPTWIGSALHTCFVQRTTDTAVVHNTNTYITFESVRNEGSVWEVSGDRVYWRGANAKTFTGAGYIIWAGHATGYRVAWIEGFDEDDNSLGTAPLYTAPGFSGVDNVTPLAFSFQFNGFDYVKFRVLQTSGGDLTLKEFLLGLSLS